MAQQRLSPLRAGSPKDVLRLAATLLICTSVYAAAPRFEASQISFSPAAGRVAAGPYEADVLLASFGGTGQAALLNAPPVLQNEIIDLSAGGEPLVIPISVLLNSPREQASRVTIPEGKTKGGGTISLLNDAITYMPPGVLNVRGDSFIYDLSDSFGTTARGTVYLSPVLARPRLLDLRRNAATLVIRFQGLPDSPYLLHFRAVLDRSGDWTDHPDGLQQTIRTSNPSGQFEFEVPMSEGRAGFFRAADVLSLKKEPRVTRTGNQLSMTFRGSPNAVYKLQFRRTLDGSFEWRDHPPAPQTFTTRSASDGNFEVSVPIAAGPSGFFRTVLTDKAAASLD